LTRGEILVKFVKPFQFSFWLGSFGDHLASRPTWFSTPQNISLLHISRAKKFPTKFEQKIKTYSLCSVLFFCVSVMQFLRQLNKKDAASVFCLCIERSTTLVFRTHTQIVKPLPLIIGYNWTYWNIHCFIEI